MCGTTKIPWVKFFDKRRHHIARGESSCVLSWSQSVGGPMMMEWWAGWLMCSRLWPCSVMLPADGLGCIPARFIIEES
jgi:hypothetical protein